jgi:hypothetical protein
VLPAALAVCEREHLGGAAFLTALAVGFEVSARLARAAVGLETVRGFHNPERRGRSAPRRRWASSSASTRSG